ncbi:hypothetical protein S245_053123, partial [Arachis hypogaea]
DLRNPKAVNQALRSGAEVQTIKKFDAGSNRKPGPGINARKLEEGTEPAALERVAVEARQAIQKARLDKKMRQAELAKQINERPQGRNRKMKEDFPLIRVLCQAIFSYCSTRITFSNSTPYFKG